MFPSPNSVQRASTSSKSLAIPSRVRGERQKVALAPGHSPLDWAALNANTPRHVLRGLKPDSPPAPFVRITKEELKKHSSKTDCWTCINGRVFNLTRYIHFHPGGVEEIMKCAGKDGTTLFNKYHSWVNPDRLLENCIVGVLI
ncbi:CIC11C00000004340 [Sungouiella intermedia]|uniref:CIC11C00000004340 n=1 Tax=Sungouiella intermedia TaxID=45354 RepID=A0A1L0D6L8_9ASCO|nr:CIC11C00000004340 [[Candida] intermedia]